MWDVVRVGIGFSQMVAASIEARGVSNMPVRNVMQALVLGVMTDLAICLIKDAISLRLFTVVTITPCLVSLAVSGVAFLARKKKGLPAKLQTIERSFAKWMDVIRSTAALGMLILLAPQAKAEGAICLSLTALIVNIDLLIWILERRREAAKRVSLN